MSAPLGKPLFHKICHATKNSRITVDDHEMDLFFARDAR